MTEPAGGPRLRSLLVAVALLSTSLPARADAIDGEWCRDGRRFRIEGTSIETYGGNRLTGDYRRHGFRYTAPAGEPDAGAIVDMILRHDDLIHLFRRPKDAPGHDEGPEVWRRCRVTS